MPRIKKLQIKLTLGIFILVAILISGFFIFGPSLTQVVNAITGNYSKAVGDPLTSADWNNLPNDFLDKQDPSGDSMAGPLTLPGDPASALQAATKQYVDDNTTIRDALGNTYRMFCTSAPAGGWSSYGTNGHAVMTVISTVAAGFTNNNVHYFVSLSGTNAGAVLGLDSIYNVNSSSFELHLLYLGWPGPSGDIYPGITGTDANNWGWRVYWCGIGN